MLRADTCGLRRDHIAQHGHAGVKHLGPAQFGQTALAIEAALAGQVGVNDNIFVGDDVIAGGGTKIFTNAPAGRVLLGYPAVKMDTQIAMQKALRRMVRKGPGA